MTPVSPVGISLDALTKRYGKDVGVDALTFDVHRGEVVGFLGPNGAGKSTAMRTLMGILKITSGSAQVLGVDVRGASPELRSPIGYLPGSPTFYNNLTAGDFLNFLANLRKVDCTSEIESLSNRLKLDLSKRIKSQSKGNRQKVGLIQALMHKPDVLILDEPTSALDPLVQHEFAELMTEARHRGVAVLLSSHVLSEVEHLADRVVIINEGKLLRVSDMETLQHRTVQAMVLSFASPVPVQTFLPVPGVRDAQARGNHITLNVNGPVTEVLRAAVAHGIIRIQTSEPSLEDIFYSIVNGDV